MSNFEVQGLNWYFQRPDYENGRHDLVFTPAGHSPAGDWSVISRHVMLMPLMMSIGIMQRYPIVIMRCFK